MEATIPTQIARTRWIDNIKYQILNIKYLFIRYWLLLGILLLALYLRLYKIADYMTFLGDEGRDVLIVKHLLEGDLVGLGPTASVGGFFTGPIYYYFMAPFLWLFRLDPVGPAIMVALFGIATVFLVYFVGKEFFGRKAGLIAAALYAVSPLVIAYSRSSWNPNPLPFFSLLAILFVYKGVQKTSLRYLVLSGIMLGIALQLHYIATFLGVAVAFYILLARFYLKQGEIKTYVTVFFGFLIGLSPFLAFEVTHGFQNIRTVVAFMFGGTGETGFAGEKFSSILGDVIFRLFGRFVTRFPPPEQVTVGTDRVLVDSYGLSVAIPLSMLYIGTISLAIASVSLLVYSAVRTKRHMLLLVWLAVGVFLFGFYKKPIYDYYFAFMFPLPFLLVGGLLSSLYTNRVGKILALGIFFFLFLLNLDGMPFRYSPNRQLAQVRQISEFVLEKTNGQSFNFALITGGNSDHAYRYFFELAGKYPVTIENEMVDPERKTVTDQLLIICEDQACQPLGHPLWEVAGFGRAEIVGEWRVSVLKVYKLVHYEGD